MAVKKKTKKITELFSPGKLYVITGPNASGKTRFAMGLVADCAVRDKQAALYIPLDKDTTDFALRLADVHSGVGLYEHGKPKEGSARWSRLLSSVDALSEAPVFLSNLEAGSVAPLFREIRKFSKIKVKLVVVDNVGQLRGRPEFSAGATLCGKFRELAREIKAAVVLVTPVYESGTDGVADEVVEIEAPWQKKRKAK